MRTLWKIALVTLAGASPLAAQSADSVRLKLMPESELTFTGTSTLHGFSCKTNDIQAFIDVDSSYATVNLATARHPIIGVRIIIPIKSLACGGELEGNMRSALKADKYPVITYQLASYHENTDSTTTNHFVAQTLGQLTIAGTADSITMQVRTDRDANGVLTAHGEYALQMTDFHITPPTFMHFLHTGNTIHVRFTLKATAAAVQAAYSTLAPAATVTQTLTTP
jgi:hypothetical protein